MEKLTEIARSFSYKLSVPGYESRDFFCSQKMEVPESEAEEASKKLFHFCKTMVMRDVKEYIEDNKPEHEKVISVEDSFKPKKIIEKYNYEENTKQERIY